MSIMDLSQLIEGDSEWVSQQRFLDLLNLSLFPSHFIFILNVHGPLKVCKLVQLYKITEILAKIREGT